MELTLDNFDALNTAELEEILTKFDGPGNHVAQARQLFPDRPCGYVRASRIIRRYLEKTVIARKCRANGAISVALMYEEEADELYKRLPEFARW